jgi:hypothetical protein
MDVGIGPGADSMAMLFVLSNGIECTNTTFKYSSCELLLFLYYPLGKGFAARFELTPADYQACAF